MVKLYTHTEEIEHCGECAEALHWPEGRYHCHKGDRQMVLEDIWGEIPSWCPLPEKATDG